MLKLVKIIKDKSILTNICNLWHEKSISHTILQFHSRKSYIDDKDISSIILGIIKMIREDERKRIFDLLHVRQSNKK